MTAIKKNKELLLDALEKSLGIVTTACKSININRATFYRYYNKDDKFKRAVDDIQNIALDFAESKLHSNIAKGDTTAIIFFLKTKGKERGYVEKVQFENDNPAPLEFIIQKPERSNIMINGKPIN